MLRDAMPRVEMPRGGCRFVITYVITARNYVRNYERETPLARQERRCVSAHSLVGALMWEPIAMNAQPAGNVHFAS